MLLRKGIWNQGYPLSEGPSYFLASKKPGKMRFSMQLQSLARAQPTRAPGSGEAGYKIVSRLQRRPTCQVVAKGIEFTVVPGCNSILPPRRGRGARGNSGKDGGSFKARA